MELFYFNGDIKLFIFYFNGDLELFRLFYIFTGDLIKFYNF